MKRGDHLDLAAIARFDYVLTNYETLQAYQQSLLAQDWHVVVLDEAQAIKNPDTYRARAARGLKRRFAIAATGTPVENRLADLWSVYDFLTPGVPFTTLKDFQRDFETDVQEGIATTLRQVAEATAARYGAFDERAAHASTAITAASAELASAATTLRFERQFTESAFAQVKAGGEAIQTASKGFAQASASLGSTATGVQSLVKDMQLQGRELQAVAALQRQHTTDMERVWPELFKTYLTQFKTAADELARSWSELYRRVQELTNSVGAQFADNTDQLADAVDRLATTLRGDPASFGRRRTGLPTSDCFVSRREPYRSSTP